MCLDAGRMARIRITALNRQFRCINSIIDALTPSHTSTNGTAADIYGCIDCKYKWLGCIIGHLRNRHLPSAPSGPGDQKLPALWPRPKVEDYFWSINKLREQVAMVDSELKKCVCPRREAVQISSNTNRGGMGRGRGRGQRGGLSPSPARSSSCCVAPQLLDQGLDAFLVKSSAWEGFEARPRCK